MIAAAATLRITAMTMAAVKARVGELRAVALLVLLLAVPPVEASLLPPAAGAAVGEVTTVDMKVDPCETT